MNNKLNNKVSWVVFIAFITILLGVMGWVITNLTSISAKTDGAINRVSNVEGDVKSINTSLQYIQGSLLRIENQLNKKSIIEK